MELQVERFLKALSRDENFNEAFNNASQKERDRLAAFYLGGMSLNEFKEKISKTNPKELVSLGEVSEDEIEKVSGGKALKEWLNFDKENTTDKLSEDVLKSASGGKNSDATSDEQKKSNANSTKKGIDAHPACVFIKF
ncbi:MAG: hypothetical protein LBF33_02620 [Oscillospiraceae bacterium]|jgi:hypothetical protein|nr:hypothetical protein [Oscillospiraceae bacterium]